MVPSKPNNTTIMEVITKRIRYEHFFTPLGTNITLYQVFYWPFPLFSIYISTNNAVNIFEFLNFLVFHFLLYNFQDFSQKFLFLSVVLLASAVFRDVLGETSSTNLIVNIEGKHHCCDFVLKFQITDKCQNVRQKQHLTECQIRLLKIQKFIDSRIVESPF